MAWQMRSTLGRCFWERILRMASRIHRDQTLWGTSSGSHMAEESFGGALPQVPANYWIEVPTVAILCRAKPLSRRPTPPPDRTRAPSDASRRLRLANGRVRRQLPQIPSKSSTRSTASRSRPPSLHRHREELITTPNYTTR